MSAESSKELSKTRHGCLAQLSGRAVALRGTRTADELSKKHLKVLMSILAAMMRNVMSEDVIAISVMQAKKMCPDIDEFKEIAENFMQKAKVARKNNPLSILFEES